MCILTATISTFCVILCTYGRPIDGFPSSHTKVSTPCRVSLVLSHRTVGGDWKDQKMQCPRCGFEMADTKTYCSQCGTVLRNFAPSSPEMEHNISPSSEYGMQPQAFSYEKLSSHPRITVLRVIRSILYFIAAPIAAFGLIGTFNALFGTSNLFEGLAIFFGLGLLVGSVVIFLRMRDRAPRLRWSQFIWSILGATVGMVMAIILASALAANGRLSDLFFGCIVLLYGFILAVISLW